MGTIAGEPRHGQIYLHRTTNKEFTESLAKTDHKTPDTFLNELIDLFVTNSDHAEALAVSWHQTFKFLALLSGSQFTNSNDLMKHLLSLYAQSQDASKIKNTQHIPQERSSNRKRKSQPRRNVKPSVFDEEGEGQIILDTVTEDEWRDKDENGEDPRPSGSDIPSSTVFDLSVVKEEQPDDGVTEYTKDKDPNQRGLSLDLQKTASVGNMASLSMHSIPKLDTQIRLYQKLNPNSKNAFRPKMKAFASEKASDQSPFSVANPYSIMNNLSCSLEKKQAEIDKEVNNENYTYVLSGLDSPARENPNNNNNSLPAKSMHVPLKYPKSNRYEVSPDEEEPQDLSFTNEQPQNLSISKPEYKNAKTDHGIKYDKNGNALPEFLPPPSSQSAKFPTPSNLIFNDLQAMSNGIGEERHLLNSPPSINPPDKNHKALNNGLVSPTQGIALPQDGSKLYLNQTGNKAAAMTPVGPVRFQVVMPPAQGSVNQSLFMSNQLMSQSPTFPGMPLLVAVGSPEQAVTQAGQMNLPLSDSRSDNNSESENGGSRKKRKKLDDTTCFRDPPETSLPFNGPNKYRFYCDVCDTGFTRRYTFNRHKCKGRVEKHYCQLCDKAYLSKYKLKDHILVKHQGQTVSCPECGKKFSSRSSMEMHKKQQHEGQFSIWCKICGKGFNHTGHYYGHMNKHTNTKPFWCQQCGKRFYGSSYLHNHKQVCRGNNDLNYSCPLCDRKFKCELYLKKHMKIHDTYPIVGDPDAVALEEAEHDPVELTLSKSNEFKERDEAGNNTYTPPSGSVFPNGPDIMDSSSNSGLLVIDESKTGVEETRELDSGAVVEAGSGMN